MLPPKLFNLIGPYKSIYKNSKGLKVEIIFMGLNEAPTYLTFTFVLQIIFIILMFGKTSYQILL